MEGLGRVANDSRASKFPSKPPPKFPSTPAPKEPPASSPTLRRTVIRHDSSPSRPSLLEKQPSNIEPRVLYSDDVDRSEWRKKVLDRSPEIQLLMERVLCWERAIRFVQIFKPGKLSVKMGLDRETILRLILQHLHFYGFNSTVETLERESGIRFPYHYVQHRRQSHLLHILRSTFEEIETVYDLAIGRESLHTATEDSDIQVKANTQRNMELEEHLTDLELVDLMADDDTDNVSIWRERKDESTIIYHEETNSIKAATLNKLVERLTAGEDHDMVFMKTFLMTLHSFATPEKVLAKLIERFNIPETVNIEEQQALKIKLRVGNVIKKWIEDYSQNDFNERTRPKLIQMLRRFINGLDSSRSSEVALKRTLIKALEKANQANNDVDKLKIFKKTAPEPKVNMKTIFTNTLNMFNIDEEELARQETILEFEMYRKIQPTELLNQAWSKAKFKHRAPNVLAMSFRFNSLSMWVATSILRMPKLKQRVKIMSRWIRVMEHLRNLNNFNGTMAVMSGLHNSAVHRLKWTKSELPPPQKKVLADMEELLSHEKSYQKYREVLSHTDPPLIPYLGVYLTDLTFIYENENMLNGLINFRKRKLIYDAIDKIQQYQLTAYNLLPIYQVQKVLLTPPQPMDEIEMYALSKKYEPRDAERTDIE